MPDTLREKVRAELASGKDFAAKLDAILALFAEEREALMDTVESLETSLRLRSDALERAEAREAKLAKAAMEALNALLDYVPTLEKQGGSMNYGRKVIRMLTSALATVKEGK